MIKKLTLLIWACLPVLLHAQNVGIGTSIPAMKLHVTSADSAVGLLENTQSLNANISTALYFKTGSGLYPYTGAIKTTGESATSARLGLFTYSSASPNQLLERLSITDVGNMGIGTISPLAQLHVVKNDSAVALFENTQTLNTGVNTALYFKIGTGSLPYAGAIKAIGENTNSARLGFFTYTSVSGNSLKERLSIADGGNVGIGITTAQTALHINPNGAGSLLIGTNRTTGGYTNLEMGINAQSNGYGYIQATKASGSSYGALAINPNGGNVGVGTTTPTSTLDVHGGISLPIKVVTSDYIVQNSDYTIVVDMQHDTNKVVNIYLPPQFVNNGRIIKVVQINMDVLSTYQVNPSTTKNLVNIYDASGTVLYGKLFNTFYQFDYDTNFPNNVRHREFEGKKQTAITLQCIAVTGWVVIGLDSDKDHWDKVS